MPDCKLTSDFTPANCQDFGVGGVSGQVYFIDYEDWLAAALTPDSGGTNGIEAIALATGAEAIKYDLIRGSNIQPSAEFTDNPTGQSGHTHSVIAFIAASEKQQYKDEWIGSGNYSRVVAIIVMDNQEVAQVYGRTVGMKKIAYTENPNDPSQGGGFSITLSTPTDTTLEAAGSDKFFITDRATTLAALETLTTPAS